LAGNVLTASAGANPVFTLTLNEATGQWDFALLRAVDHATGLNENDITVNFGPLIQATDRDGDPVTSTGSLTITIDDDSPTANVVALTGTVDEDGLANGIAGGTGDVAGTATTATGFVTTLFNSGADTPLTYQLTGSTAGLPALSSGGVAITYALAGNVLTASAGANPVFTLTLNSTTGQWDFALLRPLDHPTGLDENDITINFGPLVQATDRDGDPVTATGSLTITVDDDTPLAVNDTVAQLTENSSVTFSVFGNDGFGADGVDTTDVTPPAGVTFTQPATGTVSYNAANGQFTFTPASGQEGSTSFTYTIIDRDGDPSMATVTINLVPDSFPVVTNVVASVDDDGLAGGNPASTIDDLAVPNTDGDNNEATFSGQLLATFGADTPGSFSFASMGGTTGTVGTEMVNYTWSAGYQHTHRNRPARRAVHGADHQHGNGCLHVDAAR
jgi:T1SS-143 domain-containing protein